MPVQGSMQSLTAVVASNSPAGTDSISNTLDDYLRSLSGILRFTEAYAASLTATASMSLAAATGAIVPVEAGASATSAVTISHLGTVAAGIKRTMIFGGYATLTPSANVLLPGSETIAAVPGDVLRVVSEGSGVWRCLGYQPGATVAAEELNYLDGITVRTLTETPASAAPAQGSATLPGGLIIKWGIIVSSGTSANNATVTFTSAFPNAGLNAVASIHGGGTFLNSYTIQVNDPAADTLRMTVSVGGAISSGIGIRWIALGY